MYIYICIYVCVSVLIYIVFGFIYMYAIYIMYVYIYIYTYIPDKTKHGQTCIGSSMAFFVNLHTIHTPPSDIRRLPCLLAPEKGAIENIGK